MFEEPIINENILYRNFEFDDLYNKDNNEKHSFSEDSPAEDENNTTVQSSSITSYFPPCETSTKLASPRPQAKKKKTDKGDSIFEQCKTVFKSRTSTSSIAAHLRTKYRIFKNQKWKTPSTTSMNSVPVSQPTIESII
ncbi:19207_t:CDS:2 [Racocetra persica]|uniref:19207_t:CDS:1 n=1 Tax=Racocetra persica TaxID=160502 RepID=A0ACA9KWI0_9GLOM|nr:19207_t:CDS:2 [Racocetra persica]